MADWPAVEPYQDVRIRVPVEVGNVLHLLGQVDVDDGGCHGWEGLSANSITAEQDRCRDALLRHGEQHVGVQTL
jgi:hypothetical protein